MKKTWIKTVSVCLCAAMLTAVISAGASAKDASGTVHTGTALGADTGDAASTQTDETVYVLAGADGSVKKIIVSDWIKNPQGSKSLTDSADLQDVVNVGGDETYTMNADNMRVWNADGSDIYTQGTTDKTLPVNLQVSYQLDGKSICADDLAGKSGKVTIRFTYTNTQYETVEIDGKQEKIYVPFAMLTGLLLDNDCFTNVQVSNGKLINDGDRTAVIGMAFPGLQQDLQTDTDKLKFPDSVEITADTTDFHMMNTVTIATNEVFNQLDTTKLDSLQALTDSVSTLRDAMSRLMDGSSSLYNGLCTLLEKSQELSDGVDALYKGAIQLQTGAANLSTGAAQLNQGAQNLDSGLSTLCGNNASLLAGADEIFTSLLSQATDSLAAAGFTVPALTADNYAEVLNGIIASLDKDQVAAQANAQALAAVTASVNAQKPTITSAVTEAVKATVTAQVSAAVRQQVLAGVVSSSLQINADEYAAGVADGSITPAVQQQIEAAVDAQMANQQTTIDQTVQAKMAGNDIQALIAQNTQAKIDELIAQNMNSAAVQDQITQALTAASSGAATISALKAKLDGVNQFVQGLNAYVSGVQQAKDGCDELSGGSASLQTGAAELYAGTQTLYNGILTLKNGVPALIDGVTQLRDGSMQLSSGLQQLNDEGIEKLADAVDGNLQVLLTRVKATVDVSKNYTSFAGTGDGEVRFVYRTDEIKVSQTEKEN